MACFLVSAAEAVVVTAVEKLQEKKEEVNVAEKDSAVSIPLSRKLGWLRKMLTGGVVMLAFEHIWHGEVVPWFPFLTAMYDPGDTAEMLGEMSTVGVSMAVLITVVWAGMCVVADQKVKKMGSESVKNTAE